MFEMTDQFCWCHQKLHLLQNALIFHIVVFSFNFVAVNDNKTTKNYPKSSDL